MISECRLDTGGVVYDFPHWKDVPRCRRQRTHGAPRRGGMRRGDRVGLDLAIPLKEHRFD